eukprot:gnl/TRDRNA2_/TRDRNA2_137162_c0_seq1.p1 gnl/TRDRNA2_/TRDRNA2_137162_c0~~gnl/TRDRNA2_/TRDRNA2_137162_c0_seq1.p1  ORF type:complete len:274 (+),score=62.44 gnl/TRDRNA2_/TRDRNA2_137162_c0_seq1:115-822(+)
MDVEGDGHLTVDELRNGFDTVPEFQDALQLIDVERDDLECVFRILDSDGSGTVSYNEFADQLHKMKAQSSKTVLTFVKYYVLDIRDSVNEELRLLKRDLAGKVDEQLSLLTQQGKILSELPATPPVSPHAVLPPLAAAAGNSPSAALRPPWRESQEGGTPRELTHIVAVNGAFVANAASAGASNVNASAVRIEDVTLEQGIPNEPRIPTEHYGSARGGRCCTFAAMEEYAGDEVV